MTPLLGGYAFLAFWVVGVSRLSLCKSRDTRTGAADPLAQPRDLTKCRLALRQEALLGVAALTISAWIGRPVSGTHQARGSARHICTFVQPLGLATSGNSTAKGAV